MGILLSETAATAGAGSMIPIILMYVVIFGVFFYFVLYRPQKKEQKKTSAMLSTLEIGDCVLTSSGFYGIIIDITDDTVIVEFGNNKNCRIPMQKSAIAQVEKAEDNAAPADPKANAKK
ncbi:MAG: preprotein translocase subunit YajC [Eubacteriales bacterium]|nr:preprotein translocase subunit YajC [Eubacteriales bacterium]